MPSSFTLNNGIELIDTGEQSGEWGNTTNDNLSFIDTALDGQVTITAPAVGSGGSPNDLPITNGTASNGRNRLVEIYSGTDLGGTVYYQLTPSDAEKIIYIRNNLNTRDLIVFQGTYNASNDYLIPNGKTAIIFFNGTGSGAVAANVMSNAHFDALNVVGSVTVGGGVTVTGTVDAGTVEFDNLSGTGAVSVTNILDEDDMSSDSATALATQQSIKKYVDDKAAAQDTLAEVLANGNTTGGTNISITSGDKIVTGSNNNLVLEPGGTGNVNISADTLAVIGAEGESAALVLSADEGDDNPDIWRIVSNTDNTLGIENQISGSTVSHLTITPNATVANSTFAVAGTVTSAGLTVDGTTTLGTGAWPTSSVGKSGGRVAIVSSTENQYLLVANTNGTVAADNGATIYLGATGTTDTANLAAAQIFGGKSNATSGDFESYLSFKTSASNGTTTEAIRINSAQKVIIGATSTRGTYGLTVAEPSDGIRVFGTVNGGMDAIHFDQARGSVASPTASNADGDGSYLSFSSYDGTNFDDIGSLAVVTDGAQDAGRMIFRTTPTGSSQTERMRLNSNGHLAVGFKATIGGGQSTTSPDAVFTVQDSGAAVGKITAVFGADENTNTHTDNTNKEARVGIPHYDTDEEPAALFFASSTSSVNQIIFGGGTSRLNAATDIAFRTASNTTTATGTEAMRIDSSQRVVIGSASVPQKWWNSTSYGALFGVENNNLTNANYYVTGGFIRNTADSEGPQLGFGKSRGTTSGSTAIVQNGDTIGLITSQGADATNLVEATRIWTQIDGTPAANDMPGRLLFSTTASGNQSPTERMRINNAGTVIINPNLTGGYTPLIIKGERSSSTTLLSLETDGTGQTDDTINLDFKMNSGADAAERVAGRIGVLNVTTGAARGNMIFSVLEDAGNLIEAMRIDDDGFVGILNTNPQDELHIGAADAANHDAMIRLNSGGATGSRAGIAFHYEATATARARLSVNASTLELEADINGANVAAFNGNGLKFPNGKGIDFSATGDGTGTTTSELLDDYEEGTWTPSLTFGGGSTGMSYGSQSGFYTKVGNIVHATMYISLNNKGTSTGDAVIGGLPFTSATGNSLAAASISFNLVSFADFPMAVVVANVTVISLRELQNDGTFDFLNDANFQNTSNMVYTVSYRPA